MSEHDTIAPALVAALADLTVVEKGRTADTGKYSYDYADLADVVKLTRPVLAKHGIVALTPVHSQGDDLACTVTLLHRSGDRLDFGPFTFPHGRDAQATGSWVTYIRRYALTAALGMAAGDDDDGAKAQPRPAQQQRPQRPQAPPLSDTERHEIEAAIGALDDDARKRLAAEWKARRIRKLEELTAHDVDTVHALIVEIETGAAA